MKTNILDAEFKYFSWDEFSNIICIRIGLSVPTDRKLLDRAVQSCAGRYPYLCRKTVRRGEDLEILYNDAPIPVLESTYCPALGSEEANGHYLAVCVEKPVIWFYVYHNLTDALGFTEWIKSVIYEYITMSGVKLPPDDIRTPGSPYLPGETADPYENMPLENAIKPLAEVRTAKAFRPDGRYSQAEEGRDYLFRASVEDVMKLAKSSDGSPVAVMAYFLKETLLKLYPDMEIPVVCGIPHSFRELAAGSANYHNQVVEHTVIFDERINRLPIDMQLTAIRGMLILQSDEDNVYYKLRERAEFDRKIDDIPTPEGRRKACRQMGELIIENPETCAVSYPGRIKWGSIESYIREITLHVSTLSAAIMLAIYPVNGWFYITMLVDHTSDAYVRKMVELLNENEITAEYLYSFEHRLCEVQLLQNG